VNHTLFRSLFLKICGVELLKRAACLLVLNRFSRFDVFLLLVSQDSGKISRIIVARFSRFKSLPTPFWAFFSIAVFGYSICVWRICFFHEHLPLAVTAKPIRYGAGWIKARPPHPKIKYHVRPDEVVEESAGR